MSETMPPIVVVDDSWDELVLVDRIIQNCKLLNQVQLLETGGDCIRYFEEDSRREQPQGCILFLDLVMKPTSGLEVLERIRELPSARKSLLVMLSGLTDIKSINTGYQLGAHTFLIKPLKAEDLLQLITGMGNRVSVEENEDGYAIHLVAESGMSFLRRPQLKQPFANIAGRLRRDADGAPSPKFPTDAPGPAPGKKPE